MNSITQYKYVKRGKVLPIAYGTVGNKLLRYHHFLALGFGFTLAYIAAVPGVVGAQEDQLTPLPPASVRFEGGFAVDIDNSVVHWNKGVIPYADFVEMFRTGRKQFALGEMWGKAVRSGAMFYRYNQDPELKAVLKKTVLDLLTTRQANGSISCSKLSEQPDGPKGDLWERKYVLLGLEEYYEQVEKDPEVLQAMIGEADCTLAQIGPPPKIRIVDQGWSPNRLESCSILEPILRLYKLTGYQRYLDFAHYIVEVEGGAKGSNIFEDAFNNKAPQQIGGSYPKAYEMMSVFEGLVEYYRVTGNEHWKQAAINLQQNIQTREITLVGNGGCDIKYPKMLGEGWGNTALEQTNPKLNQMMETCVGVTWLKFCSQLNRLTGDPSTIDEIERYAYNGLLGAMKPGGDGFSYLNRLNGLKTNNAQSWGWKFGTLHISCCNLNGPMGLAYLPYIAVMNSKLGPVINLYNKANATAQTPAGQALQLQIKGEYPTQGRIEVTTSISKPERLTLRLRIPAWSNTTTLSVNGQKFKAVAGTYASLNRTWSSGDKIELILDMRCRLVHAPYGSDPAGDHFQALVRGPIVLARDENLDSDYNKPVSFITNDGYVETTPIAPTQPNTRLQFRVPTSDGFIQMVDYASANSWNGKHICTWLPIKNE